MERAARWLAIAVLATLCVWLLLRPSFEGDTQILIGNASGIRGCLAAGKWTGCWEGGQFPLLQLLPSVVLGSAGLSAGAIARSFAYLSFASFVGWFFLFRQALKDRSPAIVPIAWLALAGGYGVRYADSTFGEALGGALILGMVASALRGARPWVTALFFAGAAITKDTAFPFAGLLLVLALWMRGRRVPVREAAILLAGGGTGLLADLALNFLRFGSPFNLAYLKPEFMVDVPAIQASFFTGIWLAPNGGILFFWTSFLALALASTWVARPRLPVACVWIPLLGLTLGFSKWFAPLGWYSWGPRLMLPWLPAALLLFLYGAGKNLEPLVSRWSIRAAFAITVFPHARVLLRYQWVNRLIEAPACAAGSSGISCISQKLWSWTMWKMYAWSPEPFELAGALLLTGIWLAAALISGPQRS